MRVHLISFPLYFYRQIFFSKSIHTRKAWQISQSLSKISAIIIKLKISKFKTSWGKDGQRGVTMSVPSRFSLLQGHFLRSYKMQSFFVEVRVDV